MIRIAPTHFGQMIQAAEAAYPRECCGLLAGTEASEGAVTVTRVVVSDNVHPSILKHKGQAPYTYLH